MIVITVGQLKGGVGKTTLAVNLAGEMARVGRSVTLTDADLQGSATQWAEPRRLSFPVRHELLSARNTLVWVRNVLKVGTDFSIIDAPAGLGPIFETAVLISDLMIVPCGPSSLDLGAASRTINEAKKVRRIGDAGPGLKIVTVPTRVDLSTEEGRQIHEELADLGETVAPSLSYDVEFVRAYAAGVTVSSLPEGARASDEIKSLSLFILKQFLPRRPVHAS